MAYNIEFIFTPRCHFVVFQFLRQAGQYNGAVGDSRRRLAGIFSTFISIFSVFPGSYTWLTPYTRICIRAPQRMLWCPAHTLKPQTLEFEIIVTIGIYSAAKYNSNDNESQMTLWMVAAKHSNTSVRQCYSHCIFCGATSIHVHL